MKTITVEISDTQYAGLEYMALSPEEWVINAATERARIANDEIVEITVTYCLDNGVQVPSTREDIISYGFEQGIVQTLAEKQANDVLV